MGKDGFDLINENMAQMVSAARRCLDQREILPCLTLLYAGMDVMGSLEAAPKEGVNVSFKRWVGNYLLPLTSWNCTAIDLYGARCAIVHTFTPDSDLSNEGRAKAIYYAHSGAEVAQLEQANREFDRHAACLEVGQMIASFSAAIYSYLDEVKSDDVRAAFVRKKANFWFTDTREEVVHGALAARKVERLLR